MLGTPLICFRQFGQHVSFGIKLNKEKRTALDDAFSQKSSSFYNSIGSTQSQFQCQSNYNSNVGDFENGFRQQSSWIKSFNNSNVSTQSQVIYKIHTTIFCVARNK